MAGKRETPRQRMIGILYLVLLGLVALNVSDSILDAFKNLGNSLSTSTQNTQAGIDNMFLAFRETKLKENPDRAQPILNKAEQAQATVLKLTNKLKELNTLLTSEGGGLDEETGDVKYRSSTDISARLMINEKRAKELRDMIVSTKAELLKLTNNEISISLDAEDPAPRAGIRKTWEEASFGDGIPLTAAITALEKISADAKNAESAAVKHIFGKMDQAVVNLDKFAAVAVAPTSYLIQGQPYTAKVFLTAYDSKSSPQISVGGSSLPVTEGQGLYQVNTSSPGVFTWQGTVRVQQTDGSVKTYQTEPMTYQVSKPSAVVSPDAMNVLYIGVDNPISVSAPGIPAENLVVTGSGVSISKSGNRYVARVSNTGEATVNVAAKVDGKTQNIGSSKFRVKRIPKPTARVAGKTGGRISSAQLRGQNVVSASLENFEFDARFNISKFNIYIAKPRVDPIGPYQTSGASFSAQMKTGLGAITPGSVVMIYDIVGVGPDGVAQNLDPITFQVTN
ncbi:type IX secretion system motor protein PorM/GldM [Sphingobacterium psychroaquaticum]|uniref:Gliding motility-associated protein GldM n=1 Tax=Sphingobacterium psychroaquaticum TaxID=561061 RepID=A0A1X7L365_9SPHI|nr:gliding motility protein GldM [Sphingobacterium psychroaquaticum]SMG47863.1 gliding motility-associated protein GldM [Sphingobacterium psychroaquaticum]